MRQQHKPSRLTPSLDKALTEFILDGRARQFTKPTLDHYKGRIGAFVRWAADQDKAALTLDDVSPSLLRAYLVHLKDRGLAACRRKNRRDHRGLQKHFTGGFSKALHNCKVQFTIIRIKSKGRPRVTIAWASSRFAVDGGFCCEMKATIAVW